MSQQLILPSGIGDVRPTKAAKRYTDPTKAHQSFDGIKLIQQINGNLVLRGRNGQRDMIYRMDRAYKMFYRMAMFYAKLKQVSPYIVSQMKDVLIDFGSKIIQAYNYRKAHNMTIPFQLTDAQMDLLKMQLASNLATFCK